MLKKYIFTSESVSEGHPDKLCDGISDRLLDGYLKADPFSRVAIETLVTLNKVVLAGEVRSQKNFSSQETEEMVRSFLRKVGYDQEGFHWEKVQIENLIHEQSSDISRGVDESENKEEGAGDQGLMFGYACRETPALMPAPLYYAHRVLKRISDFRSKNPEVGLKPDGKCQLSVRYEEGLPVGLDCLVVSHQHADFLNQEEVKKIITPLIEEVLPEGWLEGVLQFHVNPTGRFVIGGPVGDTGLTGRKIIVDTYGGAAPHGGGAFSGKDPTKVDRSAAYMARYLAKNMVSAGLGDRCLIQVSYGIGLSKPLSFYVNFYGTERIKEDNFYEKINEIIDLTPSGIRHHLKLNRPIYEKTSSYGHFGRCPEDNGEFSWEKEDLVPLLQKTFL